MKSWVFSKVLPKLKTINYSKLSLTLERGLKEAHLVPHEYIIIVVPMSLSKV